MNKSQLLSPLKFVLSFFNSERGAAWFKFAYTWSDGTTVTGIVRGDLQADQNTVSNLSNVLAFVSNSEGDFISELLEIPIISVNNHFTLDGSSLEFSFTSNQGDVVKFLGSTSNFWFTTSLIIKRVRVISFEPINSAKWNMVQCFLDESQYRLIKTGAKGRSFTDKVAHRSGDFVEFASQAIQHIDSNPKLTSRILSALKTGAISALNSLLAHPAASSVIPAQEDWQQSKSN